MSKTKIYATYNYQQTAPMREWYSANKDIYTLIHAGPGQSDGLRDDRGLDNISHLNDKVNEQTSIYWLWKHLSVADDAANIGHCGYRRVFKLDDIKDIDTVDGIVAKSFPMAYYGQQVNVAQQYYLMHIGKDFETFSDLIQDTSSFDEKSWIAWINLPFLLAPQNSFVLKREVFNIYCAEAFPFMMRLVDKIDISGRDDYQRRAVGFLMERYFSYWIFNKSTNGWRFKEVELEFHQDWKPDPNANERGQFTHKEA